MKTTQSPLSCTSLTVLSVAAAAALTLSACAQDDSAESASDTEDLQQQDTSDDTQDTGDTATDDASPADDASATDDETAETDSTQADSNGDHPVYQAIDAALDEYPDGVITQFEDSTNEGGYIEVQIYDGNTEWELHFDSETMEITNTHDEGIDQEDITEIEAVEIDILDALETAETESDATPYEVELDAENNTVLWQFEMDNGAEVYVDVATGEAVNNIHDD